MPNAHAANFWVDGVTAQGGKQGGAVAICEGL